MSKFDINELKEKKNQREKELLELMSEKNVLLSLLSRPKSYPDFGGQFLHTVGEGLLINMCKKDCEMVETLFKRYFGVCLLEFQKLRPKEIGADWRSLNNMKIAAALLLDLMDISGYAYLLSEYHDEPLLKEPIEQAWSTYLNEESENQRLQFFAAAVSFTESSFEIAHRSMLRHGWKQIIQELLKNVKHKKIPSIPSSRISIQFEPDTIPIHKSPLVRVFAWHAEFLSYDGIDIFIAKYIRNCEGGKDLDFGWRRHRDLREEIQRENQRDAENTEA